MVRLIGYNKPYIALLGVAELKGRFYQSKTGIRVYLSWVSFLGRSVVSLKSFIKVLLVLIVQAIRTKDVICIGKNKLYFCKVRGYSNVL